MISRLKQQYYISQWALGNVAVTTWQHWHKLCCFRNSSSWELFSSPPGTRNLQPPGKRVDRQCTHLPTGRMKFSPVKLQAQPSSAQQGKFPMATVGSLTVQLSIADSKVRQPNSLSLLLTVCSTSCPASRTSITQKIQHYTSVSVDINAPSILLLTASLEQMVTDL